LREIIGGLQIDAEQIADGVVVLRAIQAPRRDAARIGRRDAIEARELLRNPCRDRLPLMLRWLRLIVGRHLTTAKLLDDRLPAVVIIEQRLRRCDRFEVQVALVLLVAVTGEAVLGEERLHNLIEPVGRLS
jgi:hypothetical protein